MTSSHHHVYIPYHIKLCYSMYLNAFFYNTYDSCKPSGELSAKLRILHFQEVPFKSVHRIYLKRTHVTSKKKNLRRGRGGGKMERGADGERGRGGGVHRGIGNRGN